jgi:hypothetical protein
MKQFRYRLLDKRFGGEVSYNGGETMEAANRTEVRKQLAKRWRLDVPRDARNFGFTPWRDVKIVWEEGDQTSLPLRKGRN